MKILFDILGAIVISAVLAFIIFRFADWLLLRQMNKQANGYIQNNKQNPKNNSVCQENNKQDTK